MNLNKNLLAKAAQIIQGAQSGVICISEKATPDTIAAATALYLGLTKLEKNVTLASSATIESSLVAADKIQPNVSTSGDNLVISLPYQDGAIDKVDYSIQGDHFNIVLVPGQDQQKIDPEQVKYSYTGGVADFIIMVDCESPRALGALYNDNKELFKQANKIINIDRHLTNAFFGAANVVSKSTSSTSELALALLEALKAPLDRDIATNLYVGLVSATNNFSSFSVSAPTFEAAAYLLKLGAQKRTGSKKQEEAVSAGPVENQIFSRKAPKVEKVEARPIEELEVEEEDEETEDEDWLKPKIFGPKTPGETS